MDSKTKLAKILLLRLELKFTTILTKLMVKCYKKINKIYDKYSNKMLKISDKYESLSLPDKNADILKDCIDIREHVIRIKDFEIEFNQYMVKFMKQNKKEREIIKNKVKEFYEEGVNK